MALVTYPTADKAQLSIWVDTDLRDEVREAAKAADRSFAAQVRHLLRLGLQANENGRAK